MASRNAIAIFGLLSVVYVSLGVGWTYLHQGRHPLPVVATFCRDLKTAPAGPTGLAEIERAPLLSGAESPSGIEHRLDRGQCAIRI
jgi:hypothetical protein